jgi:plastocyanin
MRSTSTSPSVWSSDRRHGVPLGTFALLVAGLTVAPVTGRAQEQVLGQLRLVERPGDSTRDLAQAVVWLDVPRRAGTATLIPASAPAVGAIVMKDREFTPHVRIVRTGGSVEFPNGDPFSHNVFSSTPLGGFDLGLYRRGASRTAAFARPGVYPIYCNIHHRMVSFVIAVPSSWYVQPSGDGRFALRDVPPGTYVLHAWHERGGETTQTLTVGAGGLAPVQLALDTRGYVTSAHRNKFGQPYTETRADRY